MKFPATTTASGFSESLLNKRHLDSFFSAHFMQTVVWQKASKTIRHVILLHACLILLMLGQVASFSSPYLPLKNVRGRSSCPSLALTMLEVCLCVCEGKRGVKQAAHLCSISCHKLPYTYSTVKSAEYGTKPANCDQGCCLWSDS